MASQNPGNVRWIVKGSIPALRRIQLTLLVFLEQIEAAEEFDAPARSNNNGNGNSKKKSSSSGNAKKTSNDDASSSSKKVHCKEHGWNFSHSTPECKVLNGGGKKQNSGDYEKKSFGDKTWNHKVDEATSSQASKKDLAAFIKKSAAKGIRHEINKIDKNRSNSESSDEEEFDMNAFGEGHSGIQLFGNG